MRMRQSVTTRLTAELNELLYRISLTVTNHAMTTECIATIHIGTARTKTAIFAVKAIMECPMPMPHKIRH
jgi:hypothetical protein